MSIEVADLVILKKLRVQIDEQEAALKATKKGERELVEILVNQASDSMIENMEYDRQKFKFDFVTKYTIAGGSKGSEQRTRIINYLTESGYVPDEKVETYQEIHSTVLQTAIKKLAKEDPDKLQNFMSEKLLSSYTAPKIKIADVKK